MDGGQPPLRLTHDPRLEVAGISRRYGDVVASDRIDLTVEAGEVVALLGENGAGKSTLLSILAGVTAPDAGEIRIDGRRVAFRSPADAIRAGVGTVFQHFALVPVFTVAEQLRLAGVGPGASSGLLAGIDPGQRIADLSVGERQRVEIARVVAQRPRLLLLDEPTSTLAGPQVETLFDVISTLRAAGVGIVFVTHKLHEALRIADRVLVIRRGRIVDEVVGSRSDGQRWPAGIDERLVSAMFGDPGTTSLAPARVPVPTSGAAAVRPDQPAATGAEDRIVLDVRGASTRTSYGRHRPVEVTFAIGAGRTLGIVGIDGQGQRELAEMLAGYLPMVGSMAVAGVDVSGLGAMGRQRAGVGYLTSDRTGEGGLPDLPVGLNLVLKRHRQRAFQRLGVLRVGTIEAEARRLIAAWGIVPSSVTAPLGGLSGGNLQKVLLAREMELAPTVLVASNPGHGLDVRTQTLVWAALRRVTDRGGVVVLLTPDVADAFAHADEVAVLSAGRLSPAVPVASSDERTISRMMVSEW